MNKIYKLKKTTKGITIAVSELAAGFILCCSLVASETAVAAYVNNFYPYQDYLDFAENKGRFKAGNENIQFFSRWNSGNTPDFTLTVPMIDFSAVNRRLWGLGSGSLIYPQYVVNARHMGGLPYAVGDTFYNIVQTNYKDFDQQYLRLPKMVVDVAPFKMLPFSVPEYIDLLKDKNRFPLFARVGAGPQGTIHTEGKELIANKYSSAYQHLSGGVSDTLSISIVKNEDWVKNKNYIENNPDGYGYSSIVYSGTGNLPDASRTGPGDSGSPLFAWDTLTHQWYIIGVVSAGWTILQHRFFSDMTKDNDSDINLNGKPARWNPENIFTDSTNWQWHGLNDTNTSMSDTKNLLFYGGGDLTVSQSVNMGAGGLFFDENQRYKLAGTQDNISWMGAGLDVGANTTVDWYLAGVAGDNLHKIGTGTLVVHTPSPGGLKVGDGTVRLDSNEQAFSETYLTSGRGRVVIDNPAAFNPGAFWFGYHGGTLDLNGHDVAFDRVMAEDEGAVITNTAGNASSLTLRPASVPQYIFNGHITGNINTTVDWSRLKSPGTMIFNGGTDAPEGKLTQHGGTLNIQGQPVIHQASPQWLIDKVQSAGDNSLHLTQQRFDQPDWENHQFRLGLLNISDGALNLARNATLLSDIRAQNTPINFGSPEVWIDDLAGNTLKKGHIFEQQLRQGESVPDNETDRALYSGAVSATNSPVTIRQTRLQGSSIYADSHSPVFIEQSHWVLSADTSVHDLLLNNTDVSLSGGRDINGGHNLGATNLTVSNTEFSLFARDGLETADSISVTGKVTGTGNTLSLSFIDDGKPGVPWAGTGDLLLASVPEKDSKNFFKINSHVSAAGGFEPDFYNKVSDGYRKWYLAPSRSVYTTTNNLLVPHSFPFSGKVKIPENASITLQSTGKQWSPVVFGANELSASGARFNLEANAGTGESSRIDVSSLALGTGKNKIAVNWLHDTGLPPVSDKVMVLASAPLDTSDNYFVFSNNYSSDGAGYYLPSTYTDTLTGMKRWLLSPALSAYQVIRDWILRSDWNFPGKLKLKNNISVQMSSSDDNWQPHILRIGKMYSSNVDFHIYSHDKISEPLIQVDNSVAGDG
ncbi:hypothetical protein AAE121_005071, partial [Salmonella enterica]